MSEVKPATSNSASLTSYGPVTTLIVWPHYDKISEIIPSYIITYENVVTASHYNNTAIRVFNAKSLSVKVTMFSFCTNV